MTSPGGPALPPLVGLPVELLTAISSLLPNRDIKSLRLACRGLRSAVCLRLTRVFLSANPRNVEVVRAVADHRFFRTQVTEIIWDDARLRARGPREQGEPMEEGGHEPGGAGPPEPEPQPGPEPDPEHARLCQRCQDRYLHGLREQVRWKHEHLGWFGRQCERNLEELRHRRGEDVGRPDHLARDRLVADVMPVQESWRHYLDLVQQQREVLNSTADIDAFRYGLQRFPSLTRVTITPFAHGELFTPLHETPMIRSFPRGFNYPLPRTWLVHKPELPDLGLAQPWSGLSEADKDRWRGFRIVARELAQDQNHRVTELAIDDCHMLSGINCTIFTEPCAEYDDLVALLRRPGFRRLDLALLTGEQYEHRWSALKNGRLQRALAQATDMQHITLSTSEAPGEEYSERYDPRHGNFVPLSTVFPVDRWRGLRHFGLSQFVVRLDDLLSFLGTLPATLRSVELNCLMFKTGSYQALLEGMRASLDWRGRIARERPRVTVATTVDSERGRIVWADKEVGDFLYGDGPIPFHNPWGAGRVLEIGVGVERDPFDPNYDRPNLDLAGLADAGYIKHAYFNDQKIY